jgi:hypothetical protein
VAEILPQADYKLMIYNWAGIKQYEFANFLDLSYTKTVNQAGLLSFTISDKHALANDAFDKWQAEVWRRPYGGSWTRDFIGLMQFNEWQHKDTPTLQILCPGLMSILEWRIIAYAAKTANRSYFSNANIETICNTLVKYNATSSGTTADGRDRAASSGYPFSGLSVEADGAGGNTWTGGFYCARKNLLTTLQDLAAVGGGDFDIVKTSSTAWQWRWYAGQLGSDKTASVVFAMDRGNMANPVVTDNRLNVKTVAIVAGQGEEDQREIAIKTHSDYSATNDIELFVDARDVDIGDSNGLSSRGAEELEGFVRKQSFNFDVLQTETSQYGVEYVLGDKVTAINPRNDSSVTVKINSVSIALDRDGKETIDVDIKEV